MEAPWRATIYKTADWLASEDRSRNPIFNAMNVTGLSAQPDLMHVKYLGYQQFWLGSVLWMLVHELLPQPTCKPSRYWSLRFEMATST